MSVLEDELKALVENISDSYPEFVRAVCEDSQDVESGTQHMVDFIKNHPSATSSDVINELSDILGCEMQ